MTISYLFVVVMVASCSLQSTGYTDSVLQNPLLTGELLFDDTSEIPEVAEVELLGVSEGMRDFVTSDIRFAKTSNLKLKRLLEKLNSHGYLLNGYEAGLTQTAAQTFDSRRGNCLSFTNLFIALAREAGLRSEYEIVESSPIFDAVDGILLRQHHITARVDTSDTRVGFNQHVSVSFNEVKIPRRLRRKVSLLHAKAHYYSNEGIRLWLIHDRERAFAYLRRSIELAPDQGGFWVNLAVVYVDRGFVEEGRTLYAIALERNSRSLPAMAGLIRTSKMLGEDEPYKKYVARVERARSANPFYHFAKAQQAFSKQDLDSARSHMERAIELKDDEPRFFEFLGFVYTDMNETKLAAVHFDKAIELSDDTTQKIRYQRLIRFLER